MEIELYDVLGEDFWGGGLTAKWLADLLRAADPEEPLTLRINSPGGDVMTAVAMAQRLAEHKGPVEARIDGLAASAASFLAAGIDRVTMAAGGLYMIHNPWTVTVGDSADHRSASDLLDKVTTNLVAVYERRSRLTEAEVRSAMEAETWYTAEEALEAGLVDAVSDAAAKAWAVPEVMGYRNAPKPEAPPAPADRPLTRAARARRLAAMRAALAEG